MNETKKIILQSSGRIPSDSPRKNPLEPPPARSNWHVYVRFSLRRVNDRIISANGVSLEGADYGAAVRVLRDSGSTVLLVVKRRLAGTLGGPGGGGTNNNSHNSNNIGGNSPTGTAGPMPARAASPTSRPACQSHRLSLSRPSKKEDFGIVLGCRLYVREVTREGTGAQVGDLVTRIAGIQADNMSLKEARKLMDQSKERLSLVVSREPQQEPAAKLAQATDQMQPPQSSASGGGGGGGSGIGYSSQNLYVPPPTRQPAPSAEDKSNLAPRGRSRGPLLEVSLSQLDLPATPTQPRSILEPPRPPPPRPEGESDCCLVCGSGLMVTCSLVSVEVSL